MSRGSAPRAIGNYLDSLVTTETPFSTPVENKGTERPPEWQVNFDLNWTLDNLNVNYGINFFDKTLRFSRQAIANNLHIVTPEFINVYARFTHEIVLRWTTDDNRSFYVGVNNLFDQDPDVGLRFYPVSAVGRFFYAGVRVNIASLGF